MNLKQNIPNALTCSNLLCGCIAIVQATQGNLAWAAYLVGLAAVFDFLDGFAARLLKVSSPIGKDLDSLADMVTFGVVPGIMMFQMIGSAHVMDVVMSLVPPDPSAIAIEKNYTYLPQYIAFLIPVFSGIRLAKFNNDTRQSQSFIGLPTPANAIFIGGLALIHTQMLPVSWTVYPPLSAVVQDHPFSFSFFMIILSGPALMVISVLMSLLLVAELPLFALKFKHFKWKGNEIRFSFLILCVAALALFRFTGIPLCILLYVLLSVINNFITKRRGAVAD